MEVALLLFMLAEFSFRIGAGSSTFLIPHMHKIAYSCLDPHVLAVLCAAALLHGSSLLAPPTCCN